MKMKFLPLAALILMAVGQAQAAPRTKAQMQISAQQALSQPSLKLNVKKNAQLRELKQSTAYSIFGYEDGGFAVISADDLLPEVLGVSAARYSHGRNENFKWWLEAMEQSVQRIVKSGRRYVTPTPGDAGFETDVPSMMTTKWDQEEPYNNYCPGSGWSKCLTGCVATAMAQVLNYHKMPEHGVGTHTIYYNGQAVTANFGEHYYDWDNMLDHYNYGQYNETEADAVATLMRDCGVAAEMQYGTSMEGGSGAYSQDAAAGLRQYFGLETAECVERDNYSDAEWMNIVYNELSTSGPVYYGGSDVNPYINGGHAFVLDGYNSAGLVSVNWGWSGDDDGMYDISLLNPSGYQFSLYQDMIIGLEHIDPVQLYADHITLEAPGTLAEAVEAQKPEGEAVLGALTVTGDINSDDLRYLREQAGSDALCEKTKGRLEILDLSEARFVEGGDPYITLGNANLVTSNDTLPERAFYGCRQLKELKLPKGIKHFGAGALALCNRLTLLEIEPAEDADFFVENNIVWKKPVVEENGDDEGNDEEVNPDDGNDDEGNNDEVNPDDGNDDEGGEASGRSIRRGSDESNEETEPAEEPASVEPTEFIAVLPTFKGELQLPKILTTIPDYALAGCSGLNKLLIPSTITLIGAEAMNGCSGLQEIRVAGREVPTLGGSNVFQGVSVSSCTLYVRSGMKTKFSKAAQWRAFADNGYDNIVEYGTTVKVRNMSREYGQENPVLGYQIKGDHVVGTPIITCEADRYSPAGRYPIHIEPGTITDEAVDFEDGYLVVKKVALTATVVDATREQFQENPEFEIVFEGFRNNEDASVIDVMPVVMTDATPESEPGEYVLTLSGGEDDCYTFDLVNGLLTVTEYVIPTGLQSVSSSPATHQSSPVYDLQGRLVGSQLNGLPAGIYMVNGRKVVVR